MANVTLRQKKIANGKLSLYLDFYPPIINSKTGKETRREFLKLQIYEFPKSDLEKQHNKETIEFAELIRSKRLIQVRDKEYGFKDNTVFDINFVAFYDTVVEEYLNKGSYNNYLAWKASLHYFKAFAGNKIQSHKLSVLHLKKYRQFLLTTKNLRTKKGKLSHNTASSYYKKFIYVLKQAYKQSIITSDLSLHAEYIKVEETHREYLTEEELAKLWNTNIKIEKVKHMAIFSALTGLRFVDIKNLTWETLFKDTHQGVYIKLREQKTGNINNHPISDTAYGILKMQETKEGFVFGEIKYSQVTRPLKQWIEDAGISKKISFHNFRHSYATLQLANGTDIYTVSKLLGHKNVSTTQIYTKVMDKNKIEAANRINLKLDGL
ncbi:site-specific integrase [Aestuariibaculum sediminum]|uniref:Site-specific integrase n=1 Tax=Aestuariibaculum sediminum TaxID=2770637 RepID=A0A8J6Q276_9FLAO|nr:site-specific integrase [Aestuariibaculum sediminum]MBD0831814.1 site-specific integrase [Aestuariibaculum sediminum]